MPTPTDSRHLRANGPNPAKILLAGGGIVVGTGVLSHELGLGGHLARALSAATQRGVDLDVLPLPTIMIRDAANALNAVQLEGCDAVVIAVGLNDALNATPTPVWRETLDRFLNDLQSRLSAHGHLFLLEIADPTRSPLFRTTPARQAWRRARRLNAATRIVVNDHDTVTLVSFQIGDIENRESLYNSSSYSRWATQLAPPIAAHLTSA